MHMTTIFTLFIHFSILEEKFIIALANTLIFLCSRETMKESKLIQKLGGFFFLLMCDFLCFFSLCSVSCCFFVLHLFLAPLMFHAFHLALFLVLCCYYLRWCVISRLALLLFVLVHCPHLVLLLFIVVLCFVFLLLVVVLHLALLLFVVPLSLPCITTTCYGSLPCVVVPCCGPSPCIVVACCVLCLTLLLFVVIHSFHIVLSLHTFSKYSPQLWFVIPHLAHKCYLFVEVMYSIRTKRYVFLKKST